MKNCKAYVVGDIPVWQTDYEVEVLGNIHLTEEVLSKDAYDLMIYLSNNIQDKAKAIGANTVLVNTLSPLIATALVYMGQDQQFYIHWGVIHSEVVNPIVTAIDPLPDGSLPPGFYTQLGNIEKLESKEGKIFITQKSISICRKIHWL